MNILPAPCANGCGKPLRPQGTNKDDWGGIRAVHALGMCSKCYKSEPARVKGKRPDNCVGCKRRLRSNEATLAEFPGTMRHASKGMCDSCYRGYKEKQKPRMCKGCESPMRSRKTPEKNMPGTEVHDSHGYCRRCRGRVRRGTLGKTQRTTPVRCVGCAHDLRPRHTKVDDHPNTREHRGNGVCAVCESAVRRGYLDPVTFGAPVHPEVDKPAPAPDAGLSRFETERRERKARAERAQRIRVEQEAVQRRFIANRRAA